MIKKTHYFGNPVYLSLRNAQLVIKLPEVEKCESFSAIVARGLVTSGLLPTLGIHHHNRYNAYCLADDIMEPYRPYVDELVFQLVKTYRKPQELNKQLKTELLGIPTIEVKVGGKRSPLMVAVGQTTASLYKCFSGESRRIIYPDR